MCMCECVYICVGLHVHFRADVHGGQRTARLVVPQEHTLAFQIRSLIGLELAKQSRWISPPQGPSPFCFPYAETVSHPAWLFMWVQTLGNQIQVLKLAR